jgi:hypothetical protein
LKPPRRCQKEREREKRKRDEVRVDNRGGGKSTAAVVTVSGSRRSEWQAKTEGRQVGMTAIDRSIDLSDRSRRRHEQKRVRRDISTVSVAANKKRKERRSFVASSWSPGEGGEAEGAQAN